MKQTVAIMARMTNLTEKTQTALTLAIIASVHALLNEVAEQKKQGHLGLPR
jgi:hypothetical protein